MPSRVYVIELSREAGRRRDPRIPWVYVGSSARHPELRFAQHIRGYKSSGLVKRFALGLRPDLYEDLEPLRGSRAARDAELTRARELSGCGFVAHSDGTSYGRDGGIWIEWGAERLAPVAAHVDEAAAQLTESAFESLPPDRCAQLLHGDRGFWVDEFIDAADPPPAYGRFAHVSIDALAQRVGRLARSRIAAASRPQRPDTDRSRGSARSPRARAGGERHPPTAPGPGRT